MNRKVLVNFIIITGAVCFFLFIFIFSFYLSPNRYQYMLSTIYNILTYHSLPSPNPTNTFTEILSLNWGNKSSEVAPDTEKSIFDIAYSFGDHYGPSEFIVDRDENIYIVDDFNNKVKKFKNGKLIRIYDFNRIPHEVNIDDDGNLYVLIRYSDKEEIIKYNKEGEEVFRFSLDYDLLRVFGLKIDGEKNIYILHHDKDRNETITKFSENGDNKEEYVIKNMSPYWTLYQDEILYSSIEKQSRVYELFSYKNGKSDKLLSLNLENPYELVFLGVDENSNFYFYKYMTKKYKLSEEDNIDGVIIHIADVILVNQGVILYKYNSEGELIKEVKIKDPTPYSITMNSKGCIYLTPRLATMALLQAPLDKYRIYKYVIK